MISYNTDYSFVALWRVYINIVSLQCNETAICVRTTCSEVFQFHKLFYIKSHIPSRNKHEYCSSHIFLDFILIFSLDDFATGSLFSHCVLLQKCYNGNSSIWCSVHQSSTSISILSVSLLQYLL